MQSIPKQIDTDEVIYDLAAYLIGAEHHDDEEEAVDDAVSILGMSELEDPDDVKAAALARFTQ